MSNHYFGPIDLTADQEELAEYYHDCTNCHAYDMNGKLHGEMVIKITYGGFTNEVEVLSTDITKEPNYPDY